MDRTANRRDPRMTLDRLSVLAGELLDWVWRRSLTIDQVEIAELDGPPAYGQSAGGEGSAGSAGSLAPPADTAFRPVRLPAAWSGTNRYAWLRFSIACPDWPAGDGPLFLRGSLSDANWNARNPQGIAMIDGWPAGGLDTCHHVVRLSPSPRGERGPQSRLVAIGDPGRGEGMAAAPSRVPHLAPRDAGKVCEQPGAHLAPQRGDKVWHPESNSWRPAPGQVINVTVLVWTGMEVGPGPAKPFELVQLDEAGERFALDFDTTLKTAAELDVEDYRRYQLLDACTRAAGLIDLSKPIGQGFFDSLPRAHAAWREAMSKIDLPVDRPVAAIVGQGHLDLAWLWPVEASHFKTLNTVINQLNIIDELPDHIFLWSQPQSWKWIQRDHPATWERICQAVRAGRWEASGGMWVEPDTNVTGGESLIRQLLYGTRFLREQLGQEETLLWLPDVFGYTAALPQLLRQFGIENFMTTKISWNEFNELPWETFHWQGLDGSAVLTHFGSVRSRKPGFSRKTGYISYNVDLTAAAMHDGWLDYQAKDFSSRFLASFGWGDGGGGPTRRQVQIGQRLGAMPGLPAVKFQRPREFFADLAADAELKPLPTWVGELYLEYHRGTYTTEGRTKRGNRLAEHALHDAELLAAIALQAGGQWDKQTFDACWEKLLLNQFHDILPGSSIQMVYDQTEKDYPWIIGLAGELRDRAAARIAASIDFSSAFGRGSAARRPVVLFNTIATTRRDPIELPAELLAGTGAEGTGAEGTGAEGTNQVNPLPLGEGRVRVALQFPDGHLQPTQAASDPDGRSYRIAGNAGIGPIGWTVADAIETCATGGLPASVGADVPLIATEALLENAFWRIELDSHGRVSRLLDKRAGREVLEQLDSPPPWGRVRERGRAEGESDHPTVSDPPPAAPLPGPPPRGRENMMPARLTTSLANQLQLFRDRPVWGYAWEVRYNDIQRPLAVLEAERAEVVERGPLRAAVRFHYAFGQSRIVQDIRIYRDIERIDFATWADWHERDTLLKAAFPVAVNSTEATFEIQFGSIRRPTHRNTSWDLARFEVPAQRWIDLSEHGYGVSLLNDCKYGHDVLGNVMRISLLRGPLRAHNDGYADQGEHRFTYSLLPHAGDWRARTISAAVELNMPVLVTSPSPRGEGRGEGSAGRQPALPAEFSFVSANEPAFVITTIKKCEDDGRLIVRGYESLGWRGPVTLRFGLPVKAAWRSRADERTEEPLDLCGTGGLCATGGLSASVSTGAGARAAGPAHGAGDAVTFAVRPFEVVTLKVRL